MVNNKRWHWYLAVIAGVLSAVGGPPDRVVGGFIGGVLFVLLVVAVVQTVRGGISRVRHDGV